MTKQQEDMDRILPRIYQYYEAVVSCIPHAEGSATKDGPTMHWGDLGAVPEFEIDWDVGKFNEDAAKAWPEKAADLAQLQQALRDTVGLAEQWKKSPWDTGAHESLSDMRADEVLNRLVRFASRCASLQPHTRAAER